MDVVYGIPIKDMNDGYVVRMESGGAVFGEIKVPGAFWADSFPLLRHIPGWAPGGSARRFGDRHKDTILSCKNKPFDTVKREMVRISPTTETPFLIDLSSKADGVNKQRVVHHVLERLTPYVGSPEYDFQELCARDAAGTIYVGE